MEFKGRDGGVRGGRGFDNAMRCQTPVPLTPIGRNQPINKFYIAGKSHHRRTVPRVPDFRTQESRHPVLKGSQSSRPVLLYSAIRIFRYPVFSHNRSLLSDRWLCPKTISSPNASFPDSLMSRSINSKMRPAGPIGALMRGTQESSYYPGVNPLSLVFPEPAGLNAILSQLHSAIMHR